MHAAAPPHPADSLAAELNAYMRYRKRIAHNFARRRSLSLHCELNRLRRLVDEKRHELDQLLGRPSAAAASTSSTSPSSSTPHQIMQRMRLQQQQHAAADRAKLDASVSSSLTQPRTRSHSESILGDLVMIINQWNEMLVDSKEGCDQGWDVAASSNADVTLNGIDCAPIDPGLPSVEVATEATESSSNPAAQQPSVLQQLKTICERVFCRNPEPHDNNIRNDL